MPVGRLLGELTEAFSDSRWRLRLLRCLVLALFGWAAISISGVGSVFGPWSQAVIGNVIRFSYGDRGQQDATVLLFREENLRQFGVGYPVPYGLHASILEALGTYRPRAVFIDFTFADQRAGDDVGELAQAMCSLHEQGIEVKLAVPAPEQPGYGVLPALLRDGCAQAVDVRLEAPDSDAGVLAYGPGGPSQDGRYLPTPAFALLPGKAGIEPRGADALEIVWVPGLAPLNAKWMDCAPGSFRESAKRLFTEGPLAMRERCPYTRTISVNHLLNTSGDEDVGEALTGRTVFYGADFRMTGDRVPISLFDELPGVFVHAMAYDNLLTFGERYKRADRDSVMAWAADLALLFLAAVLLVHVPPTDENDLTILTRRIEITAAALLGIPALALLGIFLWGAPGGLVVGFVTYLVYRGYLDPAFGALCAITAAMSAFAYWGLDLGPRNVLVFIVFFQVLREIQERLTSVAERYVRLGGGADGGPANSGKGAIAGLRGVLHRGLRRSAPVFLPEENNHAD